MSLHNVREEDCAIEPNVLTKTFWGTFTLNHAWAMVKGELPHCLPALHCPPMPVISTDFETSSWAPYADGDWYDQLPEVMRLGHNSTPAFVLSPLCSSTLSTVLASPSHWFRDSSSGILFRAADAMQRPVGSYSKLYTLRRAPTFMPFFNFASATIYQATSTMITELDHSKVSVSPTPDVNET
ncbi:nitrogen assimilation transcription factor nirA [Beauveria bassiana ARSEF 2860]|uniref:Nitrogen assimilation transcription factor nirA n=1 Tax=Beauveria bassiana (strain ARSEF 2860) TaxID=655819 RepID=J4KL07_BEAB2|nr:nitrogen assimilation transcription factor nirA [Beauveria bassiana ARSEF 2860]EJP61374.1 nitrogen assimilation transcription factor nirA [Beauveria bassiana ARSEF 2860]